MKKLGNLLILGDSYSTFTGFVPEGYSCWYTPGGHNETDVDKAEDCWWYKLKEATGCIIIENNSYSGATVCNTERPHQIGTSFITRADRLIADGFFAKNRIDTIIILGGTNDSWIDSPIGEIKLNSIDAEDKKYVLPAFAYLISALREAAPNAFILPVLNCDLKPEITDGFAKICEMLENPCLRLEGVSKQFGHPDKQGMTDVKNQIIAFLEKFI